MSKTTTIKKSANSRPIPSFVVWEKTGNIETVLFEPNTPITGTITAIKNPFLSKTDDKKNKDRPEFLLALNGKPCPSHYNLLMLAQSILDKETKSGIMARITQLEKVKAGKGRKVFKYVIELSR